MMRRIVCLLLALLCLAPACLAGESTAYPPEEFEFLLGVYGPKERKVAEYKSDTVSYLIESFNLEGTKWILTRLWVQDPVRQFRKATSDWGKKLASPRDLIRKIPGVVLGTNASGYVNKFYPELPDNYPGKPSDYFNTTLGSLVITEGELVRELEGVPFHGLALTEDGITLYRGADNSFVLATNPVNTWSFFEYCALQEGGYDLLPEEKDLTTDKEKDIVKVKNPRTVIARINRNNYIFLHIPDGAKFRGLSLYRINEFFFEHFKAEWVYNLDGGYSTALYYSTSPKKNNAALKMLLKSTQQVADVLCVTE